MTGPGAAADNDGFDLSEWLAVDRVGGASPDETARAMVVDGTDTGTPDPTYKGFAFADWIAAGDGDLQLPEVSGAVGRVPARSSDDRPAVPYAIPQSYRPAVHPPLAATVALFLTAATLAVLTVGGVLPPLGPASGLPA